MVRWTWVAAVVATAGLLAGCGGADDPGAGASPTVSETTTEAASAELTLPPDASGRCMAPNVKNLRAQDTALEGTVTSMTEQDATLEVSRMYAGTAVDSVTVNVPGQDMTDLVLAVDFEQGQTYLISSLDGQVSVCGLSGPKDELLEGLYQEAYGG